MVFCLLIRSLEVALAGIPPETGVAAVGTAEFLGGFGGHGGSFGSGVVPFGKAADFNKCREGDKGAFRGGGLDGI